MESSLSRKGQTTIPKAIREHLQLLPGDRVKFFIHPDGTVVLFPKLPIAALRGMLKEARRAGQPAASVIDMDAAVAKAVSDRSQADGRRAVMSARRRRQ